MLTTAARKNSWSLADEVYHFMKKKSLEFTPLHYYSLVYCYSNANLPKKLIKIILEMGAVNIPITLQVRAHIVQAFGRGPKELDEAYMVMEKMNLQQNPPTLEILNILIRACAQIREVDRAFETFSVLESFGYKPNLESFNSLLLSFDSENGVDLAISTLQKMQEKEVIPDNESYNHIIGAYIKTNRLDEAREFIEKHMKSSNYSPSQEILGMLVRRYVHSDRISDAVDTLDWMRSINIRPERTLIDFVQKKGEIL